MLQYFQEAIVSEYSLDELPEYISGDCVQRAGKKERFMGEGTHQDAR
jgi:hypothetical protein